MLYREKGGGLSPLWQSLKFEFFSLSLSAFQIGSRLVRQGKKFGRHSSDFRFNEPARRVIDRTTNPSNPWAPAFLCCLLNTTTSNWRQEQIQILLSLSLTLS